MFNFYFQARLRKLVVRMDHNRDGYVDSEELTSKFSFFVALLLHSNCTPSCTTLCTIRALLTILLNVVNHTKQIGHWLQCIAWRLRLLLSKTMGSKTSDSLPAYIRSDPGQDGQETHDQRGFRLRRRES